MVDFAFIDSGTGGIPYLTHLIKNCPNASCVYVGDTVNFPYGEKSHEEIVKCVLDVAKKIIDRFDPSIFVVACNTMSVNTLDILREVFPKTQFIGTVPAIKLAAKISTKRRIGLLATKATVEHPYNIDLKNHFAADCQLILRADPKLISFIEKESFTSSEEECIKHIEPAVDFFKKNDCDTIILGCTHFLNLAELIQKVCGTQIKVVDSRDGVVKRCLSIYDSLDCKNKELKEPCLFITGFSEQKDKTEYDVICQRFDLEWGGLL